MRKILIISVVGMILCSCSSSKSLIKDLSKYSFLLGYPYDSDIIECERNVKIAIGAVRTDSIDLLTYVNKTKRSVYPFIFYNLFKENFWVRLGQNSLEQSFPDFFLDSFLRESFRTGCYTVVNDPKEADFVIDLILKDCKTESVYQMKSQALFLIYYYMTIYNEYAFSAFTDMEVQIRIIGRSGRSEKTYKLKKEMPWTGSADDYFDDLRYDFMANMAESLSMTTKECIEMIIRDINLIIRYEPEE